MEKFKKIAYLIKKDVVRSSLIFFCAIGIAEGFFRAVYRTDLDTYKIWMGAGIETIKPEPRDYHLWSFLLPVKSANNLDLQRSN